MKNILLCALNSKFIHSSLAVHSIKAAYDYFCIKTGEKPGNVIPCEFTINDSYQSVLYQIISRQPDAVCFSVYLWNAGFISSLCKDLKACFPKCIIVLGGPEVSYGIDSSLWAADSYDYVIKGEGEKAFFALLLKLYSQKPIPADEEFRIRTEGKTVKAMSAAVLNDLPFVYNNDNISLFKNRIVYYESSRGCPFNCAYCLSSAEQGVRFLPIERVCEDLSFFIQNEVPLVKFVDRTFNCNKKRSYEILKYIIENGNKTCFHFEVAADLFDEATLELLKAAPRGRIQFEIGIQSTNETVLAASCRTIDTNKVLSNIKALISMKNINIHADLIVGLPYEDYDAFSKSFNDAYAYCTDSSNYIHQLQVGFLKLLHGAPLNGMLSSHGYVFSKNPPYQVLKNSYLSAEELNLLIGFEDVFERYYNSGRFHETLCFIFANNTFASPFDFYMALSQYYRKQGYLFSGISSRKMYDVLVSFLEGYYSAANMTRLKSLLLFDYFSSDSSDLPPASLHSVWKAERYYKEEAAEVLAQMGKKSEKACTVRFVGEASYVFNYSCKNPVTGRFDVCK